MIDDTSRDQSSLKDRASALFGAVGVGFLLNIALIAWSVYQEYWWIAGIAVVIGLAMLWQVWGAYHSRKPNQ